MRKVDPKFPAADDTYACDLCRTGTHEDCKRLACACLKAAVTEHTKLFRVKALLDMTEHLQESGAIVVLPGEPLPVYQLLLSGTRWGQFLTEAGAKAAAQEELDELHRLFKEHPEENDEYEELMADTLTWEEKRWSWMMGGEIDEDDVPLIPVSNHFSETGYFIISTVEIKP